MLIAALLALAAVVVAALANVVSARVLQADDTRLNDVLAHALNRARAYRRIVVDASPLDQNAAVQYQLAYKELEGSPKDALARLRHAVERDDPATWDETFGQYCQEVSSARISTALRSTRCDWRLYLPSGESSDFPYFPQTAILGYCFVLDGRLKQRVGNERAAADRYVQAAAYASDVSQGSGPMVLPAILVSRAALRRLAELIASVRAPASVLPIISQELAMFRDHMPSVAPGLSEDSALVANDLYEFERSTVDRQWTPLGRLWPWNVVAAWQLWRPLRLADGLDRAAATADLDTLRQLPHQIDRDTALRRWVAYEWGPRWDGAIQDVENLQELLAAVQIEVPLQEWRIAHGRYPSTLPFGQVSPEYGLSYRPSSNNQGYQLVSRADAIVLDVNDGGADASQGTNRWW